MVFDRRRAYGMRLNIPAGTATRFEVVTSTYKFHFHDIRDHPCTAC